MSVQMTDDEKRNLKDIEYYSATVNAWYNTNSICGYPVYYNRIFSRNDNAICRDISSLVAKRTLSARLHARSRYLARVVHAI